MENKQTHIVIISAWVNLCRALLAATFIFSGFVKANDPAGTAYKIHDYLEVWGWGASLPDSLPFFGAVLLGVFEFALGFYLLFGIHRRIVPAVMFLAMCILTPLTLWLALTNPISDCGCFGDAVKLTNWNTFWKNTLLLTASFSVFYWRKKYFKKLVTEKVDWFISLYGTVFIIIYAAVCIRHLPVFDFRPYHIGANIRQGMEVPEGEKLTSYETTFIYRKGNEEREFDIDHLPTDSTWTFVDSKTRVKEQGYEPPIHDFQICSAEDGTDLTEEVLGNKGYTFLLVAHQLQTADDSGMDLINEIYDYSMEHGYGFYCVTASRDEDIATWQENTGAEYPFATMDDTTLKTMIRSNPGLLLLKDGVVINKWSGNDLPDEYQLNKPLDRLPLGQLNPKTLPHKIMLVAGWFIAPLLILSLCDAAWLQWKKRKKKKD